MLKNQMTKMRERGLCTVCPRRTASQAEPYARGLCSREADSELTFFISLQHF